MASIKYDSDNWQKCICPDCPVQENSSCSMEKKPNYQEKLKQAQAGNEEMPSSEQMIGLYCSDTVGQSACQDLNCDGLCQCPECDVFKSNGLGNMQYCI